MDWTMNNLETAYELGRRRAVEEHLEKVAFMALARGAGSLIARGYRAARPYADKAVSSAGKTVSSARGSTAYKNLAKNVKYIAKDTVKSPLTYAFGGIGAYTTEGSFGDKLKAGLLAGGLGSAAYRVMGGAYQRALGTGMRMSGATRSKFTSDLMSRGLKKSQAHKAVLNRQIANRYGKSGDIAGYDKYMSKYKDSLKDLTTRQRVGLAFKYDKKRMATGALNFGVSGLAAEKAYTGISNMVGAGPQQQNRMYERMTSNYPPPAPRRTGTIAGNNNPYTG